MRDGVRDALKGERCISHSLLKMYYFALGKITFSAIREKGKGKKPIIPLPTSLKSDSFFVSLHKTINIKCLCAVKDYVKDM